MLQALIFDFDGLIIDSEITVLMSWQELYQEYGYELPVAEWLRCIGTVYGDDTFDPRENLERQFGRPIDWEAEEAKRFEREIELVELQPVLPGVTRLITEAKASGLKLAVGSSSPHRWVDAHLKRLGLWQQFDVVVCGDDVPHVKPEPDVFLLAAQKLDVDPAGCIVLEDSPHGAVAAQFAGMFCVVVPNRLTRRMNVSAAGMVIDSLADISLADLQAAVAQQR